MLENINDLLKDKVIVISGGTKGVAKAVAIEAARQGADVVISGRDEAAAEKVLQEIENAGRRGLFVKLNLRNPEDCARLFEETMEKFGKVDGFLNYAGTTPANSLVDENPEQFDAVFDINVRAAFFCAQHAVRCMQKGNGGSIVMIGSPHAWCGQKDRAAYSVSKGALLTLTEHIAHHYAEDKIRANFVTMGWTPTEGELALRASQGMTPEETRKWASSFIPYGRMTEVEDQVPGILYLLSDYSQMTIGANLRMTGGLYF